jgi:hypothetical protein
MTVIKPSPNSTPSSVTRHRARDAPVKTDQGSFVLEVIIIVANCVLSPNSARKIVPKVVRKTFPSIAFPPQIVFCLIEDVNITHYPAIKQKRGTLAQTDKVYTKGLANWL